MNTLQNYSNNSFYTKFYPALQSFTGCAISTLMIDKLEFWFSNPKYVGGFYKFVEPCGHPLYREGDSWSEELGVSRKLFAKAFDVIGIRYNSKSAYLRAEDTFQGKLYASYHDRKTNRTYFVRNHEFTSQLLGRLLKKKSSTASPKPLHKKAEGKILENSSLKQNSPDGASLEKNSLQNTQPTSAPSEVSQSRSRNGDLGRSYTRASSFIHKKTSPLEGEIINPPPVPDQRLRKETEEMIKIWKQEIGELGIPSLSNGLFQRLQNVFKDVFDRSLESWKAYCQMISSSKFLMGEAQNKFFKKAWITWAINQENIERIKGGDFSLGDRQTNHDKKIEVVDREIKSIEYKKYQIEMKIENIKSEEQNKRKEIVKEKVKTLSKEERQSLEQDFEALLKRENNSMTEEFRKFKWKGMFISSYFDSFVEEKIYSELFKKEDKDNDEKVVQSSGLLELLDDVCYALALAKQEKRELDLELHTLKPVDFELSTQGACSSHSLLRGTDWGKRGLSPLREVQNTLGFFTQETLSWA